MRSLQALALLAASTLAQVQEAPFAGADTTPQVAQYAAPAAVSSVVAVARADLKKRNNGTCGPMPEGKGPIPSPDTQYAFLNSNEISAIANAAPTPPGYKDTFKNLQGSTSADNFLGYDTLDSYNTSLCATKCDEKSGCVAINLFMERSPTLDVGPDCPNPASTTLIKCAFWGSAIDDASTTNSGYTDNSFVVAIAASNGYVQNNVEVPGSASGRSTLSFALLLVPLLAYML